MQFVLQKWLNEITLLVKLIYLGSSRCTVRSCSHKQTCISHFKYFWVLLFICVRDAPVCVRVWVSGTVIPPIPSCILRMKLRHLVSTGSLKPCHCDPAPPPNRAERNAPSMHLVLEWTRGVKSPVCDIDSNCRASAEGLWVHRGPLTVVTLCSVRRRRRKRKISVLMSHLLPHVLVKSHDCPQKQVWTSKSRVSINKTKNSTNWMRQSLLKLAEIVPPPPFFQGESLSGS